MGFLGLINAYQLRVCLSVAITEMVLTHSTHDADSPYFDPDACPEQSRMPAQNASSFMKVRTSEVHSNAFYSCHFI